MMSPLKLGKKKSSSKSSSENWFSCTSKNSILHLLSLLFFPILKHCTNGSLRRRIEVGTHPAAAATI
jgi:hypothetical protein